MYTYRRNCAMHQVIMKDSKVVVFQSLNKRRVMGWIQDNGGLSDAEIK